jgi:chaperonin cofactor prefoldin
MDPKEEHVILQKYRELVSDCQQLMQKIAELETDCHEHKLVEQTLQPLDPERRAYRLVGDVLVERTVKEVLPSVTANRENVRPSQQVEIFPSLAAATRVRSLPSLRFALFLVGKCN